MNRIHLIYSHGWNPILTLLPLQPLGLCRPVRSILILCSTTRDNSAVLSSFFLTAMGGPVDLMLILVHPLQNLKNFQACQVSIIKTE